MRMRKRKPSGDLSLPDTSGSHGVNADSESEEHCEEIEPSEDEQVDELSEEEPVEEDPSPEPSEGEPFEEDPSEELIEEEASEEEPSQKLTVEEEASEGSYEEPNKEDLSEESECKVFSDCDYNGKPNSRLTENNSADKKRSVESERILFYSRKKCKNEQPPMPGSYSGLHSSDLGDKSRTSKGFSTDENNTKGTELTGSSGKKRRTRWETEPEGDGLSVDNSDVAKKRRKTRWAAADTQLKILGPLQLPDFVNGLVVGANDPEIQELYRKLMEINQKLQAKVVADSQLEKKRSPSQLPIFNELGDSNTNLREGRLHAQLIHQRQEIIRELINKNPTFKPPSDDKPQKLYRKLYIPVNEYPGYNFIGLIIGPSGNNQKRMEKESGAKILLRGKGSVREERALKKDAKRDPSENEDLHVLVEADNQKSLDVAVGMVEKLLIPVDESMNMLKRAQLRELAELRGKAFKIDPCDICGDGSHRTVSCPLTAPAPGNKTDANNFNFFSSPGGVGTSSFGGPPKLSSVALGLSPATSTLPSYNKVKIGAPCDICGDAGHLTVSCPLTASAPGSRTDGSHSNLFSSLRGTGLSPFCGPPVSSMVTMGFNPVVGALPYNNKFNKDADDANLFVGYLPVSVDEARLVGLFSPFGSLSRAKVIRDKATGLSKGYGFVKYANPLCAAKAVEQMNGHRIDGKMLAVRVAGRSQVLPASMGLMRPTSIGHLPMYPGPAAVIQQVSHPTIWPGPPGSMLPEAYDTPYSVPRPSSTIFGDVAPPEEFAQFPGNPRNLGSHHVTLFSNSQFHHSH